jgi:hypothetical protein
MTPEQVGDLLALAAAFDDREVGDAQVLAWLTVIGDLEFADARAAVVGHYAENTRRIMPADVRQRVKRALRPAKDQDDLRKLLDPVAYRREVAAADARFLRQLAKRAGRPATLKAINGGSE